ncbi:MAG: hypothetical protein HFI71_08455 [Lachnospiraceae bacterium]|jgi:hypothetical protein|nr:hypothetical protein [Lachnospiraceae bacterium]
MRRKNSYKFADKKHSKRGKISLSLALLSLLAAIAMVALSIQNAGNASVYIGSAGLLALILTVVSFVIGISSLLEDSYKLFPVLGSICSGLMLAGWVTVYVLGFYV